VGCGCGGIVVVIGIDPGLTGAVSFISPNTVAIEDIPTMILPGNGKVHRRVDGYALASLIRKHVPAGHAAMAVCEAVHAMPGNDIGSQGSLLRSLGAIEAVLDVLRLKPRMVSPQTWQAHFGLKGKKTQKREPGELPAAIVIATALYPEAARWLARVKDHNRAEATLIGHFGLQEFA